MNRKAITFAMVCVLGLLGGCSSRKPGTPDISELVPWFSLYNQNADSTVADLDQTHVTAVAYFSYYYWEAASLGTRILAGDDRVNENTDKPYYLGEGERVELVVGDEVYPFVAKASGELKGVVVPERDEPTWYIIRFTRGEGELVYESGVLRAGKVAFRGIEEGEQVPRSAPKLVSWSYPAGGDAVSISCGGGIVCPKEDQVYYFDGADCGGGGGEFDINESVRGANIPGETCQGSLGARSAILVDSSDETASDGGYLDPAYKKGGRIRSERIQDIGFESVP